MKNNNDICFLKFKTDLHPTMKKTLLFLLVIHSISGFSQCFFAGDCENGFFVDIRNMDTAVVERFNLNHHNYFVYNRREVLVANSVASNLLFVGTQFSIEKSDSGICLHHLYYKNKSRVVVLKPCNVDKQVTFRKMSFLIDRRDLLYKLKDSLSGPDSRINVNVHHPIFHAYHDSLPEIEYTEKVDRIFDSLVSLIQLQRSLLVDEIYMKIDSMQILDSTTIFSLLSKANYDFDFGLCLLEHVALQRPECLIGYIDSNPLNKKKVLKAIRYHKKLNEINQKIKVSVPETKGKKRILKQKTIRDIDNVASIVLFSAVQLSELTLIVMFFVWVI